MLSGMTGFINAYKPPGPTSHDIVARARRILGRDTKVGHAGTLDPFAEGVLVLCIGAATRLAEYVQQTPKAYRAEFTLGARSNTDDIDGQITLSPGAAAVEDTAVREALTKFVGTIRQVPPSHSAVHFNGRRAYQAARAGEELELTARDVRVDSIELLEYAWPRLRADIRCGSGTYIRSIARDLGESLGVGAYCSALVRTAVGEFRMEDSVRMENFDASRHLQPPLAGLSHLPKLHLDEKLAHRLTLGQAVRLAVKTPSGECAALDAHGELLGIARVDDDGLCARPVRILCQAK